MIDVLFRTRWKLLLVPVVLVITALAALLIAWARPAPRIVVEPKSQDLGELPQQHLELVYTVRNEGNSPLQIEEVTTSCACTKGAVEESTIAPGRFTLLRVTMDPQKDNVYGNLFRVITLRSNDPAAPKTQVDFRVSIPKPGE